MSDLHVESAFAAVPDPEGYAIMHPLHRHIFVRSQICLLKLREICALKCFVFISKCTKMRLAAGFCLDLPLGELQGRSRDPKVLEGKRRRRTEERGKGDGMEGEADETSQ